MKQLFVRLLREEERQELIEYTLLLGIVALPSAPLFIGAGQSAATIWTIANSEMSNAAVAAS